jgi:hypothetical protein
MPTLTSKEFRRLFESQALELPGAFGKAADYVVREEVEKSLAGEPHKLVPLAEYLLKVSPDHSKQSAKRFLEEVHGFEGDYAKAWAAVAPSGDEDSLSPTRDFQFYRAVLRGLNFPGNLLTKSLPRNSRHWSDTEAAHLRETFVQVFEEECHTCGANIIEHFAQMHDEITWSIQKRSGVSFKRHWKENYEHERTSEQRRALRTDAEACAAALEEEITRRESLLCVNIPDRDWEGALWRTRQLRDAWSRDRYWERKRFLYRHVYEIAARDRDRLDIRKLYAKHFSIGIPNRYAVVDVALQHRIKRIWRETENRLRATKNMPKIGDGWIGQAKMLAELRAAFPGERIEAEATPAWLGRMRFDAFFTERNIAVEYQGEQHDRPVTLFGGKVGHAVTKGRDESKRQLASANGCQIVYVHPDYLLNELTTEIARLIASTAVVQPVRIVTQAVANRRSSPGSKAGRRLEALGTHDVPGCARHGTYELVRTLASEGADFAELGRRNQNSPLYYAAEAGNLGTLRALLELGLLVNAPSCERGATVLARLCCHKEPPSLPAVRMLLEWKADPTIVAPSYSELGKQYGPYRHPAPMIAAAASGNLELSKLLREFGVSVNIRDRHDGSTPFLVACGGRPTAGGRRHSAEARFAMLKWLIDEGANPRAQSQRRESGLELAAQRLDFHEDWKAFELLVALGLRLRLKDAYRLKEEYSSAPTPNLERLVQHAEMWGRMPSY